MRTLILLLLVSLSLAACGQAAAPGADPTPFLSPAVGVDATSTSPALFATEEPTIPTAQATAPGTPAPPAEVTVAATINDSEPTVAPTLTVGETPAPPAQVTKEAQVTRQYDSPPPMVIDIEKNYSATIDTSMGTIEVELWADEAPRTVNNFVFLARAGYYDGLTFHRVIPGFVIQGGDPLGTGSGGPGYQFLDEPITRRYEEGSLAMANAGPDTNGSQFFIVTGGGYANLQMLYNHFGRVTSGQDIVDRIAAVPANQDGMPRDPVLIEKVTIHEG